MEELNPVRAFALDLALEEAQAAPEWDRKNVVNRAAEFEEYLRNSIPPAAIDHRG